MKPILSLIEAASFLNRFAKRRKKNTKKSKTRKIESQLVLPNLSKCTKRKKNSCNFNEIMYYNYNIKSYYIIIYIKPKNHY